MSSLQRPLAGPRELDHSLTDLDGLIHGFFRAQMPDPWPALKPPAMSSIPTENNLFRRRSLFRSRLVLAASLLMLLLGQVFVSGLFPSYNHFAAVGDRGKIEATHRKLHSPKPPAGFNKAGKTHPPGEKGMLISERR
jgi:hypothetical protein